MRVCSLGVQSKHDAGSLSTDRIKLSPTLSLLLAILDYRGIQTQNRADLCKQVQHRFIFYFFIFLSRNMLTSHFKCHELRHSCHLMIKVVHRSVLMSSGSYCICFNLFMEIRSKPHAHSIDTVSVYPNMHFLLLK